MSKGNGELIMYCTKCGKEIRNDASFCPYCGNKVIQPYQNNYPSYQNYQNYQSYQTPRSNPADTGSMAWGVLGFFLPVVGFILWLVWKDERPLDAKVAGKGALISVIIQVGISVLFFVLFVILGITSIIAFS